MSQYPLTFSRFGEHAVLINWPSKIDENILFNQIYFKESISEYYLNVNVEINIAYNSIVISYDDTIKNIYSEIHALESLYSSLGEIPKRSFNRVEIPVCYNDEFGMDLNRISHHIGLSKPEIIDLHSAVDYRVFFIGFLPGFPYLGGMEKQLSCPRLDMPRPKVEQGSVAIGGDQTGIYPVTSPGGWNIIGRTPVELFNSGKEPPCLFEAGDKLRFVPVTSEEFHHIGNEVSSGRYKPEKEVVYD